MSDTVWHGILALVVFAFVIIVIFNGLVGAKNRVVKLWADIDTELKRRYDLIPKLVEVARAFAAHERAVFENVSQARNLAQQPGASPAVRAEREQQLQKALMQLYAIAEQYPALRADQHFQRLQSELIDTENRIQTRRSGYNGAVMTYNNKVQMFPSNIIAGLFRFDELEFFEFTNEEQRLAPEVKFQS